MSDPQAFAAASVPHARGDEPGLGRVGPFPRRGHAGIRFAGDRSCTPPPLGMNRHSKREHILLACSPPVGMKASPAAHLDVCCVPHARGDEPCHAGGRTARRHGVHQRPWG